MRLIRTRLSLVLVVCRAITTPIRESLALWIYRHFSQIHVKSRNSWAGFDSFAALDGVRCGSVRIFLSVRPRKKCSRKGNGTKEDQTIPNPRKSFRFLWYTPSQLICDQIFLFPQWRKRGRLNECVQSTCFQIWSALVVWGEGRLR